MLGTKLGGQVPQTGLARATHPHSTTCKEGSDAKKYPKAKKSPAGRRRKIRITPQTSPFTSFHHICSTNQLQKSGITVSPSFSSPFRPGTGRAPWYRQSDRPDRAKTQSSSTMLTPRPVRPVMQLEDSSWLLPLPTLPRLTRWFWRRNINNWKDDVLVLNICATYPTTLSLSLSLYVYIYVCVSVYGIHVYCEYL